VRSGSTRTSRPLELLEFVLAIAERPVEVVHHANLDALARLSPQHVGYASRKLVSLPDEVLQVDVVGCRFHVGDEAVELLRTRREDLHRLGGHRMPVALTFDHRDDLGDIGAVVARPALVGPEQM
jgi:hypothetical protein